MTILPKKKPAKEKSDGENTDHSQHQHSTTTETRVARRTSSPPRWLSSGSREERLTSHDPGGRYDDYESGSGHNKRRHRSSPHRNVRKHRLERPSCTVGHPSSTQPSGGHPHNTRTTSQSPDSPELQLEELELQTGYNSEDEYSPQQHPENLEELERWFRSILKEKPGFIIKSMGEDGACLFRSVADQIYGDQEMHATVRQNCCDYMAKNADFFRQYVTENFDEYLRRKRLDSCHGNHIELQALSELYNRPIEVYQYSAEPMNTFHGTYKTDNEPLRLSYHRNMHYNSVIDPCKATIGVGLGLPGFQPGLADKTLMSDAIQQSENIVLEKAMLEDKLRETDWEVTQETIEEQVARESYLQWLRDNEKRAVRQSSTRTASATCSSAPDAGATWWDGTMSPETRPARSPRNRSNNTSQQNSPNRAEVSMDHMVSMSPQRNEALHQATTVMSLSPNPSTSIGRCPTPEGAVGGVTTENFPETNSLMNQLPPNVFGLSEWDEDDIIAQVMAQSQQEYLDSLKANKVQCSDTRPTNDGAGPSWSS